MVEREMLTGLTAEELDGVISLVREVKKERKAELKAQESAERAKEDEAVRTVLLERLENATEGTPVAIRFILKNEEVDGELVKVTEKRFIALVDGEKKTVMFNKFVA